MIGVESRDYGAEGVADLGEAIRVARDQGIANARGAVNEELLWPMFSLGSMVGVGLANMVPGVLGGTGPIDGSSVYAMDPEQIPELLLELLGKTEDRILECSGPDLPGWHPTKSKAGVRMVVMRDEADFAPHSDDYEGLVAAVQLGIDGKKVMRAEIDGEWYEEDVNQGDVLLFGGDTFSDNSRTLHAFRFAGLYAVSFTLGQDPWYTISGKYPLIEENPQYNLTRPAQIQG